MSSENFFADDTQMNLLASLDSGDFLDNFSAYPSAPDLDSENYSDIPFDATLDPSTLSNFPDLVGSSADVAQPGDAASSSASSTSSPAFPVTSVSASAFSRTDIDKRKVASELISDDELSENESKRQGTSAY